MINKSVHYALNAANPTYVYINAFVDELQRAGLRNVIICPGSRSTPLALVCAAHPAIQTWMHIDERSAAFFGLGMAKRLRESVALVCTSGTAAANFLPAIVEAKLTHVPLLALTADRPYELRDCGAPQAIDQNRLYGTHVKWFVDVALPEATNAALRYIRTLACRAVALTTAVPSGPVHLNLPFREPLTPDALADQPLPPVEQRDPVAWQGRPDNAPYVLVNEATLAPPTATQTAHLADLIGQAQRGLIIVGPIDNPALTLPLVQLAQHTGYPILADPLSQLRNGEHDRSKIITSYDAFLRLDAFSERAQPELILRFGAMPTAKPLLLYLKRYASCPQIVIDGYSSWDEPTQLASEFVHAEPAALCCDLLTAYGQARDITPTATMRSDWLTLWQQADTITRETLSAAIQDFTEPFEGRIFTELNQLLPTGTTLYVGNSMPVRDMDTFFWGSERPLRSIGNRGGNGIDGVISSALGASAVSPRTEPVVLVIGDLSFFHDLNGLLAAHLHHLNLTIVLVNNDGGGIFSFLPQAAHPEHFEQLFGTPTGLDFRPVVQMYGGTFERVASWEQFRQAVTTGINTGGLHVVELATERISNVAMHRQLWQLVDHGLRKQLAIEEVEPR
ncbi:MAG TPA: 2-succinyl-5-enolpyruvyl-6-hydroxy-3-cyclohexene-1-carboxylic-acid synthase [Ktedonobacteraceae bacterium]|nr:2-succinyl-5-enolpyruvyl-6-hydroxy-3-cyclohexene-1-carboxylic-acid synthase [Ktedonobacteraceae bacterium]